jgi:hypothetical protein
MSEHSPRLSLTTPDFDPKDLELADVLLGGELGPTVAPGTPATISVGQGPVPRFVYLKIAPPGQRVVADRTEDPRLTQSVWLVLRPPEAQVLSERLRVCAEAAARLVDAGTDQGDPRSELQKEMWACLAFPYDTDWHNLRDTLSIAGHAFDGRSHDLGNAECCPGAEPLYTPDELRAGRADRPFADGDRDWYDEELEKLARGAVSLFVAEECELADDASVAADVLYERYLRWEKAVPSWPVPPLSEAVFDEEMRARLGTDERTQGIVFVGVR